MDKQKVFAEFLTLIEKHRPDLLNEAKQQEHALLPSFGDWLNSNFPDYRWDSRLCMNLADDMRDYFERHPS